MIGYQILRAGNARITGGFFGHYMDIMMQKALPYQWRILNGELDGNPTVNNFRIAANEIDGSFEGVPYQDTDLAKWLDAVGCALANRPDKELECIADSVISIIVKAQDADGYLDTYYQLVCADKKWTDPESHELYCFGHMIEAGISYFEGTGKRALLNVACRLADHIRCIFGPGKGQIPGYRGHEIIEMALIRLAEISGNQTYSELATYFITTRRDYPELFYLSKRQEGNPLDYGYWGWGDPERELSSYEHVTGHAVRAMYLYSGIADVARETNDTAMQSHCERLFSDVVNTQMYVTGGIGSTAILEAFTYPYDLPNDTMYAETCASIGLCFFAQRLLRMRNIHIYADVIERCFYNILPAAVAQDGIHYFYVNPLDVNSEACLKSPHKTHVKLERQSWYECACCPPNLARIFLSLPRYLYTFADNRINVHLYAQSEATLHLNGQKVFIEQQTNYPFQGEVILRIHCDMPLFATIALRIPEWCQHHFVLLNGDHLPSDTMENGYLLVKRDWHGETIIRLSLDMESTWLQANIHVRENSGKVALSRGPLVYCIEEADNGPLLNDIVADLQKSLIECTHYDVAGFGVYPAIIVSGTRSGETTIAEQRLYFPVSNNRRSVTVTAIPYCLWGERTSGEMIVWLQGR